MEKATTSITNLGSAAYAARRAAEIVAVLWGSEALDAQDQVKNLNKILEEYGERSRVAVADLRSIEAVSRKLYAIFETQSVEAEAALINDLLREYGKQPRLTSHGGTAWHIHIDSSDHASWAEWLATSSALAFAMLLAEKQRSPCGICASPVCGRPFIDLGKGGGRSYCSPKCSSRERVAKYRAKR
jgi:predicted RNA-binding Zn ribbon-like protein